MSETYLTNKANIKNNLLGIRTIYILLAYSEQITKQTNYSLLLIDYYEFLRHRHTLHVILVLWLFSR